MKMKIEPMKILIRDLVEGYVDNDEEGVFGYGGRLNIRPKYQREFIYGIKERNAVIESIQNGFPLNTMYWVKNTINGTVDFEVLDGQQRTISICQYVNGDFSLDSKYFETLTQDKQEEILNYPLTVYFCEGADSEKLKWFEIVNIAGKELTPQELRNAVYPGPWLSDAKLKFSKTNCAAYSLAKDYVSGSPIRQDYLQTAIAWIIDGKGDIRDYMADHRTDTNANELWQYFQDVIHWVKTRFQVYRKEMKGIAWGILYNRFKDSSFDAAVLEERIKELMEDEDVSNQKGIYEYVLSGDERCLNIRGFKDKIKRTAYERQNGICAICKKHFTLEQMEGDHKKPWCEGGKTELENCQMLCKACNRDKGAK